MKILSSQKGLYIVALALLVVTNIFVLTGVTSNRSGEPEAIVQLTERELRLPYSIHKENSGLSLSLNWRALPKDKSYARSNTSHPDWLDIDKLSELGFDIDKNKNEHHKRPLPIEVFVVLENDGPAYQESLKRTESFYKKANQEYSLSNDNEKLKKELDRLEKQLNQEKISKSRLFAIDAGTDPVKLRSQHSNSSQYIITRGMVKLGYRYKNDDKGITGYVSGLSINKINVPLHQRELFTGPLSEKISKYNSIDPPRSRYSVEVAYGSRYEPWIKSIDLL